MEKILDRVDLNLLKLLTVLIEELNVTNTAKKLHLAQPSVSRQLKKLRLQIGDELFISSPTGLIPTTRCEQLAKHLPEVLDQLSSLLSPPKEFDPATKQGDIILAINPILGQTIPAMLCLMLQEYSPLINFQCNQWDNASLNNLANDQLYFGINYNVDFANRPIHASVIATDRFKVYAKNQHPLAQCKELSFEQLSHYPFAIAQLPEWNERNSFIKELLMNEDLEYRELFRSEIISNITNVVENTEALFPVSEFYVDRTNNLCELSRNKLPSSISKTVMLYTHRKRQQDPYFLWLEEKVKEIIDEIIIQRDELIKA